MGATVHAQQRDELKEPLQQFHRARVGDGSVIVAQGETDEGGAHHVANEVGLVLQFEKVGHDPVEDVQRERPATEQH